MIHTFTAVHCDTPTYWYIVPTVLVINDIFYLFLVIYGDNICVIVNVIVLNSITWSAWDTFAVLWLTVVR